MADFSSDLGTWHKLFLGPEKAEDLKAYKDAVQSRWNIILDGAPGQKLNGEIPQRFQQLAIKLAGSVGGVHPQDPVTGEGIERYKAGYSLIAVIIAEPIFAVTIIFQQLLRKLSKISKMLVAAFPSIDSIEDRIKLVEDDWLHGGDVVKIDGFYGAHYSQV
ncbi:hypothetical protein Cob_v012187 [Colletotrichum orbiculare MAFF 240422]|uniref:Uncharacterized protein n=1 Tax=Colletotrichum orbiculare (strain 104-T / ATCC 96160 / CBS 514.97 / LARS 414 / MAFF 240422) TaxID=1213857 RepID=A0A484FBI3_COLOR|nr:hypothetical protein Cob_v012187 [Colletotrichum orbiculare MAFF 240422]